MLAFVIVLRTFRWHFVFLYSFLWYSHICPSSRGSFHIQFRRSIHIPKTFNAQKHLIYSPLAMGCCCALHIPMSGTIQQCNTVICNNFHQEAVEIISSNPSSIKHLRPSKIIQMALRSNFIYSARHLELSSAIESFKAAKINDLEIISPISLYFAISKIFHTTASLLILKDTFPKTVCLFVHKIPLES